MQHGSFAYIINVDRYINTDDICEGLKIFCGGDLGVEVELQVTFRIAAADRFVVDGMVQDGAEEGVLLGGRVQLGGRRPGHAGYWG